MKKMMKYETPEIEITKFEVETDVMNEVVTNQGETGQDGDRPTVAEPSYPDVTDIPLGF